MADRPRIALLAAGPVGHEAHRWLRSRADLDLAYVSYHDEAPPNAMDAVNAALPAAGPIDLGVLAWWPTLLRDPLLSLPRLGWLNMHPSLLPFNRGKHPNFWAIVDQTPAGASLHFVDRGVDTGPILAQERLEFDWTATGKDVYQESVALCLDLFRHNFDRALLGVPLPAQPHGGTSHFAAEMDLISHLDLDQEMRVADLLNLLRARTFPPHPACWFHGDDGERYEVRVEITRVPRVRR